MDSKVIPLSLRRLIREFSRLPTIGEKSASRLAYHIVYNDPVLAETLGAQLKEAVDRVVFCDKCYALTERPDIRLVDSEGKTEEKNYCVVCKDPRRDKSIVCVVEKPIDIASVENFGEFNGVYHVLHGLWSPVRGRPLSDIKLNDLLERVELEDIREVILALGSTVEGDATSLYIASELEKSDVKVTRIAQGMPKGGELEFADNVTLSRAFSGRQVLG